MGNKVLNICIISFAAGFLLFIWWVWKAPDKDSHLSPHSAVPAQSVIQAQPNIAIAERNDSIPGSSDQSLLVQKVLSAFCNGSEGELAGLTVADLFDESLSLTIRRKLAWYLAQNSRPEDMALIWTYLSSPDVDARVKAVIVEALGHSTDPAARDWLVSALDCGDVRIIRAALRGLAEMDDPRNAGIFIKLLSSASISPDVREAAAEALGRLSTPESGQYLMEAWESSDPAMRDVILQGLARRNMDETADFFDRIMQDSSNPDLRLAVVESVSQASGNPEPFLLNCLGDTDPAVRAEAAWGLALQEDGNCAEQLIDCLSAEPDESVKEQLYNALGVQSNLNAGAVLALAQTEMNDSVRLSAYGAVIERFDDLSPADRRMADLELSSELKWMAVNGESLNVRLRAAVGLRRMQTESSENALKEIIAEAHDPRVIHATGVTLESLLQ